MPSVAIEIKKTCPAAKIPECGTAGSAGYDLHALLDESGSTGVMTIIEPHQTSLIGTGIKVAIPLGYCGLVFARSGLASKRGLRPANCVGVIDSDYRGEILVALHNDTDNPQSIQNGERIAQLVVTPCLNVTFKEVDKLSNTDRGAGGFGSTGN